MLAAGRHAKTDSVGLVGCAFLMMESIVSLIAGLRFNQLLMISRKSADVSAGFCLRLAWSFPVSTGPPPALISGRCNSGALTCALDVFSESLTKSPWDACEIWSKLSSLFSRSIFKKPPISAAFCFLATGCAGDWFPAGAGFWASARRLGWIVFAPSHEASRALHRPWSRARFGRRPVHSTSTE